MKIYRVLSKFCFESTINYKATMGKKSRMPNPEDQIGSIRRFQSGPRNVYLCINEVAYNDEFVQYTAWTDGACDNLSPESPGGSAYIVLKNGHQLTQASKGFLNTTNNRMEMLSIISAANYVAMYEKGARLDIYSDSQYSINVLTGQWSPKMNFDLIELFGNIVKNLEMVVFHWVKGHSGIEYNEKVDELAYNAYLDIAQKNGFKIGKYV